MRLGFIGAGKAGNSIARYLWSTRNIISGFYSKTYESARTAADDTKSVAFLCLKDVISESDIIFVTTPDRVIETIWEEIRIGAENGDWNIKGKIFCHCSGSLSSEVFADVETYEASCCAAHPMQAISSKATDLGDTFFTLDGIEPAKSIIKRILEEKGNKAGVIDSKYKKKYHMAASTASNLVVGLIQMSVDSLKECGLSQGMALEMLKPLILGNIRNICEKGAAAALTGPVERSDCRTVTAHLQELAGEKQEIYRLLSKQLIEIAQEKNPTRDYSELKTILEEKDQ